MLAHLEQNAYAAAREARSTAERLTRAAAESGQPPPHSAWQMQPAMPPVNVERAVCQLLLGRVEDAVRAFPNHHTPPLRLPIPRLTFIFTISGVLTRHGPRPDALRARSVR